MVEAGKDLMNRRKIFDENFKSVLKKSKLMDFNDVSMVSKKYIFSDLIFIINFNNINE